MPETDAQTVFLEYGGERIPVRLEFRERNQLSISVDPDGSVTALAPVGRPLAQVLSRLERRRSWIARQRRHFERFQPLPNQKRYVSGETHLYLGRRYRLKVHCATGVAVKLLGGYLHVSVPRPGEPESVAAALKGWYQTHAESVYGNVLERCRARTPSLRRHTPPVRIRDMKRRWGSCSNAGTITLSLELIKAPLHCIEYVVMHELCHLQIHNHSPAFYRLLSRCMPDWERRKARIDSQVFA